ncbi:MAG: hypothetical protein QW717_00085 [Candidatus Bathyarchaeia archaeon]
MTFKDECKLCRRVLPYNYLRKCRRCGKLFCVDCMVPDVSTSDTSRLLCLNCARKTVSSKHKAKYEALTRHLKFRSAFTDTVRLSLAQIDGIIRDNLPISAYRSEKWWENSPSRTHSKSWLDAGWKVQEVNLEKAYIIFKKVRKLQKTSLERENLLHKPFTPPPSRILTKRKTSKTKMAKLYARIKNIERNRTAKPKLRGNFKPKPTHEKRVFKPKNE